MKTIEILSNGRQVQFTTKSVTIEGREYQYSHISELRHSEAKRIYGFKCDGDTVMLPYEEKDAQVLKVIFSRVQQMHSKAEAAAKAGQKPAAPKPELTAETPVTEPSAEEPAEAEPAPELPAEEPAAEPVAEEPAEEPAAEPVVEEPVAEEPAEEPSEEAADEAPALSAKEKKRLEKEQRKADKEAAKRENLAKKAAAKSGRDADVYMESETAEMDQMQKSARFRKAIIIFLIILAVFALMGVAYYFLIGPASDPQIGPNTTDQTQYNDIDDMINDLEN